MEEAEELCRLRLEVVEERARRVELEEENDLLALANVQLQNELAVFRKASGGRGPAGLSAAGFRTSAAGVAGDDGEAGNNGNDGGVPLLGFDGDGRFANQAKCVIDNACGSMNVLSVSFCNASSSADAAELVACGGTDNCVSVYDIETAAQVSKFSLTAPILMLDSFGCLLACSMMDGGVALINLGSGDVRHLKDHSKYVVGVRWSPDGRYLASVSHDKSVHLYRVVLKDGDLESIEKHNALRLAVTPESCFFARVPAHEHEHEQEGEVQEASRFELVIALRDTNHLIYMDCETFAQRHVSLNENAWDTHVSITPLFLLPSPDMQCVLVATDKNMHFLTRLGKSKRLKVYAGHNCGDYGKPKVAFDATGQYIYSNSENDSSVFVYDVNSTSIVGKLSGHKNIIKDVCCSRKSRIVATASFDHTVIVWHRED